MARANVYIQDIERRLSDAAGELRANSHPKESDYSIPVLGLIFLEYADSCFSAVEAELESKGPGRRKVGDTRAAARLAVDNALDELPERFTTDLYEQKCDAVYKHVFDSYWDNSHRVYERAVL